MFIRKILPECCGSFIVHYLELGFETRIDELLVQRGVCPYHLFVGSVLHRLHRDCVDILVIQGQNLLVSATGLNWESACQVAVYLAHIDHCCKYLVSFDVRRHWRYII
jgi:hypothetical protein